uniref:Uncharacterized protein n=1 Tax=Spironucleus salmonicida TaxID=348837 RepID=V6LED0_9EUKA|eukprot:EST42865.1 Hypothetical protein SS50377_ee039 [Spironucleus salmonicida]
MNQIKIKYNGLISSFHRSWLQDVVISTGIAENLAFFLKVDTLAGSHIATIDYYSTNSSCDHIAGLLLQSAKYTMKLFCSRQYPEASPQHAQSDRRKALIHWVEALPSRSKQV